MLKQEELFVLIKSMTRSEKRYFKLYCNAPQADYMLLFEAIEKQQLYNEQAIKEKFSGATFLKQLHVLKNYLRKQIMASLRSFHNEVSKDAILKDTLRNVEVLFHKELFQLCSAELSKAESLAEQYELNLGMIEIQNWKRKLSQALTPHNYKEFDSYVHKQSEVLGVLKDNNGYWKNMILETWKTFGASTAPERPLEKANHPQTLDAKVLYYNTRYIKSLREGNAKKGEKDLRELIELLEEYPHRLKEEPASYISTINNLTSYLVFSKRDKEALELINKAKSTYETFRITSEKKSMLKQILRTYNIELEIYRNKKRKSKKDFVFIGNTEKFIGDNKNKIPVDYLLSFWFQLASLHFSKGNYDKVISWLNNLLNSKHKTVRTDLHKHARMLNIMVHFERRNLFVLRYFIDSARRYAKKYTDYQPYEEQLFRFFTRISKAHEYEYRQEYKQAYDEFFPQDEESMIPDIVLDYVDYKAWLKNNIERKNIR